jgi:hypothetical protein
VEFSLTCILKYDQCWGFIYSNTNKIETKKEYGFKGRSLAVSMYSTRRSYVDYPEFLMPKIWKIRYLNNQKERIL